MQSMKDCSPPLFWDRPRFTRGPYDIVAGLHPLVLLPWRRASLLLGWQCKEMDGCKGPWWPPLPSWAQKPLAATSALQVFGGAGASAGLQISGDQEMKWGKDSLPPFNSKLRAPHCTPWRWEGKSGCCAWLSSSFQTLSTVQSCSGSLDREEAGLFVLLVSTDILYQPPLQPWATGGLKGWWAWERK